MNMGFLFHLAMSVINETHERNAGRAAGMQGIYGICHKCELHHTYDNMRHHDENAGFDKWYLDAINMIA